MQLYGPCEYGQRHTTPHMDGKKMSFSNYVLRERAKAMCFINHAPFHGKEMSVCNHSLCRRNKRGSFKEEAMNGQEKKERFTN